MKDNIYHLLIRKYLTGGIAPQETKQLDKWLEADAEHQKIFQQYKKTWESASLYDGNMPDFEASVEADLAKLKRELATGNEAIVRRLVPRKKIVAIAGMAAVGLLLLGMLWFLFLPDTTPVTAQTGEGEKLEITLPDGSSIFLNENTTVSYDKQNFNKKSRQVTLQGEAFFEIEKDPSRAFIVQAGNTETKVLGTSFNIKAKPIDSLVQIAVWTGKVAFGNIQSEPLLLTKNMAAVYNKNKKLSAREDYFDPNIAAWKTGELFFDETPLPDVLMVLEKYFRVDIEWGGSSFDNCKLSSRFDADSIEKIMEILEVTFQLKIEKSEENVFRVTGGGCD